MDDAEDPDVEEAREWPAVRKRSVAWPTPAANEQKWPWEMPRDEWRAAGRPDCNIDFRQGQGDIREWHHTIGEWRLRGGPRPPWGPEGAPTPPWDATPEAERDAINAFLSLFVGPLDVAENGVWAPTLRGTELEPDREVEFASSGWRHVYQSRLVQSYPGE